LSAEAKQFTNIMATGNVLSEYDAEGHRGRHLVITG
jgi:hypothetical protein